MKHMVDYKKIRVGWMCIVLMLYVLLLVPIFRTINLSVISADDFSMGMKNFSENLFLNSVLAAKDSYMNWSGAWLLMFLETLLNPINFFEATSPLYGVEMNLFVVCLVVSVLFFVNTYLKVYCNISDYLMYLTIDFIVLVAVLFFFNYTEIYYWFVGVSYAWTMSLTFCTFGLIIKYYDTANTKYYVGMILFGILACTGLNYCVPLGVFYLYISIQYKSKFSIIQKSIPIVAYVISGGVTAFAPGNFVRKDSAGESVGLIETIINTTIICAKRVGIIIVRHPTIMVLCLLMFFMGALLFEKERFYFKYPFASIVVCGIGLWGAMFPTAMGYSSYNITDRIEFVFNTLFIVFAMLISLSLGQYFSKRLFPRRTTKNMMTCAAIIVVLAIVTLFGLKTIKNAAWYNMVSKWDEIQNDHDAMIGILESVRDSNEEDVYIDVSDWTPSYMLKSMNVYEDTDWWVNKAIAKYYGKNSVSVKWNYD